MQAPMTPLLVFQGSSKGKILLSKDLINKDELANGLGGGEEGGK